MVWFRVDDSFYDHPKTEGLSDSAVALWTRAGCYCAKHLTDGFVSQRKVNGMCDNPEAAAAELVAAGLWDKEAQGYRFHDWHEYQPTRAEALATSKAKSIGGAVGNHRRWHVERGKVDPHCPYCQAGLDRTTDRMTDSHPNPPARPDPTRPEPPPPSPPADGGGGFTAEWEEQVIAHALALRPDWLAEDIRRALRHRTVRQRPVAVVARAMELIARDPASKRPSRLAANHEHWSQARLQLRAQDHAGGGKVPPHDPVPDGSGGCARCPLPGTHPVHQTHPKDHP